jgi:hypothetical protein
MEDKVVGKLSNFVCVVCFYFFACVSCFSDDYNVENNDTEENFDTYYEKKDSSLCNTLRYRPNTMKWGGLYILFPHISLVSCYNKITCKSGFYRNPGIIYTDLVGDDAKIQYRKVVLSLLLAANFEYKFYFTKKLGFSLMINFNNPICIHDDLTSSFCFLASLEIIYLKVKYSVFSLNISLIGIGFLQDKDGKFVGFVDHKKKMWLFGFTLLKYEHIKSGFYINCISTRNSYYNLFTWFKEKGSGMSFVLNLLSIELGFNFVRVIDSK